MYVRSVFSFDLYVYVITIKLIARLYAHGTSYTMLKMASEMLITIHNSLNVKEMTE